MEDHGNRKAWEQIQQNLEYHDVYQEWCGRQFYFYQFTGEFYIWEKVPLNEDGRKYAEDFYSIMFTERVEKQDEEYRDELREAISEVEDMGLLEPDYFPSLKSFVGLVVTRLEYLDKCHKNNYQPEVIGNEYTKTAFIDEFQKGLNASMLSIWLRLIKAVKPYTPFEAGFWPLNPLNDYEEVQQYDLMNQGAAAAFVELDDDGEILVKIDPKMPDKLIMGKIKFIIDGVREKHGIKKAVRSGTLTGTLRGMLGVSDELVEAMEKDFRQKTSIADLTRIYYESMKRPDDQPLSDYTDITESRIYRKIWRWSKTLDII